MEEIRLTPPVNLIQRQFKEANVDYRDDFMRDRDRVMYSTAFRRLAGKTQIYTTGIDDHKRNRLTHTLEVSQIARTIAQALKLDCNLAEAIALGHDLGHTPFGHAGERMLHDIMVPNSDYVKHSPFYKICYCSVQQALKKEGVLSPNLYGFKHNLQSVRVATVLEDSYRDDENNNIGLNLTNYTLWGMMNHSKLRYSDVEEKYLNYHKQILKHCSISKKSSSKLAEAWSLEAYIVELADEISQWHHDLEDALRGQAMFKDEILKLVKDSLKDKITMEDVKKIDKLNVRKVLDRKYIADLSHVVVNTLITDIINTSRNNIEKLIDEIDKKGISKESLFLDYEGQNFSIERSKIISFSEDLNYKEIKTAIRQKVHHSREVERMNEKGKYIIRKIFEAYCSHPQQLPDGPIMHFMVETNNYKNIDEAKGTAIGEIRTKFNDMLENGMPIHQRIILMRRICDHIASMTDRYAIDEYKKLYD